MLKYYIKNSFRNIKNEIKISLIKSTGLIIGITSFILVMVWVLYEFSYDKFYPDKDNIYFVNSIIDNQKDKLVLPATSKLMGPLVIDSIKEAVTVTRISERTFIINHEKDKHLNQTILFVDTSFFSMFSFKLISGNIGSFFNNPLAVIVTKDFASNIFKGTDPLGKIINVDNRKEFVVAGVIDNFPKNSRFNSYGILSRYKSLEELGFNPNSIGNISCVTYIKLIDNCDYKNVEKEISGVFKNYSDARRSNILGCNLVPMPEMHLYSSFEGNRIRYIKIFSITALLVLIIGCINYINLSSARFMNRSLEVGIKKVNGAGRKQLLIQFFTETSILTCLSFIVSILLFIIIFPFFRDFLNGQLGIPEVGLFKLCLLLISTLIVTVVFSGLYPAIVFSGNNPVKLIKTSFKKTREGRYARKILAVFQFSIAIILIIVTVSIKNQVTFMQNKDLGLSPDNLVYIRLNREKGEKYEIFKNELLKITGINGVTATSWLPSYIGSIAGFLDWEGREPGTNNIFPYLSVDYDFCKIMNISISEGRSYSKEFTTDANNYLLNETAIKQMGLDDPIGKRFKMFGREGSIIGVVNDFHFKPLNSEIEPLLITLRPGMFNNVLVKIHSNNIFNTIDEIKKTWKDLFPEYPINYNFLDQRFAQLYQEEKRINQLSLIFTLLAIVISCLGLFGLAIYSAESRIKEIGVRKVNGARTREILAMLNLDFITWVTIAISMACPVAYYFLTRWLENYAYKTQISWWVFVLAGAIALLIALITVSYQSYIAASRNPVKSLKYE